jgi:hypothetical protein
VRISRPLIGTGVAAAALGATMAWGLTMASASTGTASQGAATHSAVTSASKATPSAAPSGAKRAGQHCPHMSGRSGAPASTPGALPG